MILLMTAGFEGIFYAAFFILLKRSLTTFAFLGIGADNLCLVSQQKCWKSNIFNNMGYVSITGRKASVSL